MRKLTKLFSAIQKLNICLRVVRLIRSDAKTLPITLVCLKTAFYKFHFFKIANLFDFKARYGSILNIGFQVSFAFFFEFTAEADAVLVATDKQAKQNCGMVSPGRPFSSKSRLNPSSDRFKLSTKRSIGRTSLSASTRSSKQYNSHWFRGFPWIHFINKNTDFKGANRLFYTEIN
jgi:hypothetical protein